MHKDKYIKLLEETFAACVETVRGKVDDYAEDNDAFSNFRLAATAAGVTIEQVLLMMLGVKLARLENLLVGNRIPKNESIDDTIMDSINYAAILKAYRHFKNCSDEEYAFAGIPDPSDEEVPPPIERQDPSSELEDLYDLTPVEKLKALFWSKAK